MPEFLDTGRAGFDSRFASLLQSRTESTGRVDDVVAGIIEDVRRRGDDAVIEMTRRLDRFEVTAATICMGPGEIAELAATVREPQRSALSIAAERIRSYHLRQLPPNSMEVDETGSGLGWRWSPIGSVGHYVPGGLASYPSSVLMNTIPAAIAGVRDRLVAAPTPDGRVNPLMLLAAEISGVSRIFRIGGAQAIAALALGTESVPKVDKITGPGNAYVTAAKRQLYGHTGMDMVAGPSEIVIIADDRSNPSWIAADLLAQAEHDPEAQSVLITDCREIADGTAAEIARMLEASIPGPAAAASWRDHGAVIIVRNMAEAIDLANRIAPEHLQLSLRDARRHIDSISNAGAIFLGEWSPEVVGDYVAGPSHVLPTHGAARHGSGLSVLDFMKRSSIIEMNRAAFAAIGPAAEILAQAEGLPGHAAAVRCRLDSAGEQAG